MQLISRCSVKNHLYHLSESVLSVTEGLKYSIMSKFGRVSKPKQLIYMVTDLCNLRCEMCCIWKRRGELSDLTLEEAEQVFSDPWLSDVEFLQFNGGEPTARPEIETLCERVIALLPKLKRVNLTTNGYDKMRCLALISTLQRVCDKRSISFSVQISLDGDPPTHDKIRGRQNAFKRSLETISALKDMNVAVFLNATISRTNFKSLDYLESLAQRLKVHISFMPVLFRERNLNEDTQENLELHGDAADVWSTFCKTRAQEKSLNGFFNSILYTMSKGGDRAVGCRYMFLGGCIIASNGDVRYCPNAPLMPNLRERSLEVIMRDPANVVIREQLSLKVCPKCVPYGPDACEAYSSLGKYIKHRCRGFGLR